MEQNIFDVSDDISFPWLPAYAEATEANGGTTNGTTSSRMLETIVEETSDDDDGRDKDHRRRGSAEEEEPQPQQPLSWSQYEHVWSSGGSDAESVIRVETPSDQDTMSERDFICPPKRRKQETFGDEFLSSELSIYGGRRPPRICEPDGLVEPNEYFMKRHNEQRLRFDEIGHDLFTDSDSLSYASLSRSSSLIQFESLERQLQSETAAHQHPLSGSSPSLYSTEPAAGADAAAVTTGTRGSKVPGSGPGPGGNRLTTSNLIQKAIGQTALNISDSELYSSSVSSSSSSSSSGSSAAGSSGSGPASCPESSSNASSTSSSGYRYGGGGGGSDECAGLRQAGESTGSDRSPDDAGDTEEELLSATVRCCSSQRCSQRWPRSGATSRNKNSIESLSEDSGYCDHLGLVASGVLRVRSKSLTNFGSTENISFLCGGQALPPVSLLPATMAMQQHHQQQPLSMDYIGGREAAGTEPGTRNPARLSTVCDVEDEEDEYDVSCISATTRRPAETIEWPSGPADVRPAVRARWTNINNGTKIEHDPCKQRSDQQQQGPFVAITTRLTPPTPPSSRGSSSSSSEESLSPPPPTAVTTTAVMASRSEVKNSSARERRRGRIRPSFSAPDLLLLFVGADGGGGGGGQRSSPFASGPRRPTTARYDPISFTVSSVPECLNLYGSSKRGGRPRNHPRNQTGFDSSDESGGERSYYGAGYGGGSVASKNFDLYDLQPQAAAAAKCSKTVTFCVGGGAQTVGRPRQNIRASYANLLALNYSDEDDEDDRRGGLVYGRARGPRHHHQDEYYLSRNTFRTSSGTKLGRGAATPTPTVPPTALLRTLRPFGGGGTTEAEAMEPAVARCEEEDGDDEDEESRIFPLDREETSVFNSLLEEISAHFDRNLSIINDQAEAYEPIAAFLLEQRGAARPAALQTVAGPAPGAATTPPQPPPRRTQIKTNPHVPAQSPIAPRGPTSTFHDVASKGPRRTFDQDPTNLVTCYAASLERCRFDPTESTSNLYDSRSSGLNAPLPGGGPTAAAGERSLPPVKREFVASTPNLNYCYGVTTEADRGEQGESAAGRLFGDQHHHNSLKNVASCRSTGILASSSSRCGLSKGVSFCPIVSEIIWKSTGSVSGGDSDNASIISSLELEDAVCGDEHNHSGASVTPLERNASPIRHDVTDHGGGLSTFVDDHLTADRASEQDGATERDNTTTKQSVQQQHKMISAESGPVSVLQQQSDSGGGGGGGGATMTSTMSGHTPDSSAVMRSSVEDSQLGYGLRPPMAPGVDVLNRNGGGVGGGMESQSLIASEATVPREPYQQQGLNNSNHNSNNNNNNSSLIRNFKNGKAEKKGKTFLSRLSSGFRFSFRNKSKKSALKETTFGVTAAAAAPTANGSSGSTANGAQNYNNNHITTAATKKNNGAGGGRLSASRGGNDSATADFIYIPLKDPSRQQQRADESMAGYHLRQMNTLGVTVDDSFTGAEDEPDDCEIAVTRPPGYYRSDSSTALNGSDRQQQQQQANHVLSSKPPLPKLPPRVVGVSTKRQQRNAHAPTPPPRDHDHDDDNEDSRSSSCYYRKSPTQLHQYAASALVANGADSVDGTALVSRRAHYDDSSEYGEGGGGGYYYYDDDGARFNATMGSEQKIGLIETNLDTHETIISGKTRSLMELGGPHHHYRHQHHHQHPAHHPQQPQQQQDPNAGSASSGGATGAGQRRTIGGAGAGHMNGMKGVAGVGGVGAEPSRPHKSMEFLLDKENQRNVLPPENELQKSHETGTNLSEHQLRVQASLQRLNIPDWYKQYSGKDGVANTTAPPSTTVTSAGAAAGGLLRKRNSDVGRWTGLSSKTTSLSSLGSHRSDRSPVMLSPSAHSHHGQTGFSRWSTSHLNSNQTSPSVSTRGSFTRGGLNASVISGYSNTSTTGTGAGPAGSTAIRNSFRQPYLGWRSQEKLSQPRTPAERLASSLLQQQQQQSSSKQKEQQQQQGRKQHQQQQQHKDESVVTPEIQSSIIEVTSAIVHYVNDQTNRHSRSRSTSPSQRCWLESSFVGTRPLDSPQTPMIENSSVLGSTHQQQQQSQQTGGDHYRFNAGRMNGVGGTSAAVPTFSLPTEHQSPGSATLEDVLASLLGLPADPNRSSVNSSGGNHTLQIEPLQTRRRSEGDAATRKRNDSGGSMAISGVTATGTTTTNTTTATIGSGSNQSGHTAGHQQQQQQQTSRDLLSADVASRIARRVSLDSAEAAGHQHGHGRGHDYLKCRYPKCDASATLAEARKTYKSCHNCSHLYCSRECRRAHWERHRKACLHSRVSALCRLVLSACKDDADTLRHLSALARRGYLSQGRGVVRILFRSPERADSFLKQGFQCLGEVSYVRWPDLLPAEMGPELYSELLKLSTEYKPDSKMLLYVAICVVSEAPGSATAPVKWERQLVSRCAKLKLCRSVVVASDVSVSGPGKSPQAPAAAPPRKDTVGDVLVLSFQILAKTTPRAREQVSTNIQSILCQRGVQLRKHYPEVYQRLATFVEGTTDRFLPVTLHPRDSVTGRSFVCIIMPNYGEVADRVQFPVSENSDDRVVTIDVGADLGDDLTSKL